MPNKSGMVKYKTNIILDYRGVREHDNLFILNCRKDEVILGLPWLWAINLEINWKDSRVMITPSNYRWTTGESPEVLEQWYLLWYMLHNKVAHIKDELYDTFKTWTLIQCAKFFNTSGCILEFVIKWMTISMIIAQEATKEKVTLPMAFKEYKDVFSKKKNPPNYHPLDHMTMPSNSRIVCIPMGQGLPAQFHWTSSLQRVHWRIPQDRENLPLKVSPSHAILLCQEKRSWETMPLSRLSVPQ